MKKLIVLLFLLFTTNVFAGSCESTRSVHPAWYPLLGYHAISACTCDACHINGVFKGTPRDCISCHTGGRNGTAKTAVHIPTNAQCDSCHSPSALNFSGAVTNHTGFANNCSTCHSGAFKSQGARGKPSDHIPTTLECDSCHKKTTSWSATFTHQGVVAGTCASCHNGTFAKGKSATHIPTTASCDSCHKNYSSFTGVSTLDIHAGVTTGCATCHNGTFAKKATVVDHSPMPPNCESCHKTTTWVCHI